MEENIVKNRIAHLLYSYNITQKELAQNTNLTEGAVSHYIKGDRIPRGAILLNIANALGTTVDFLTGKSDIERKQTAQQEKDLAFELIARNAKEITEEERKRFAKILFS